jgi:hypothetical protein
MADRRNGEFTMSDQQDNQEVAHLKRVNADLTASLKRCRVLLDDCRSKLAANSNEPQPSASDYEDGEESERG